MGVPIAETSIHTKLTYKVEFDQNLILSWYQRIVMIQGHVDYGPTILSIQSTHHLYMWIIGLTLILSHSLHIFIWNTLGFICSRVAPRCIFRWQPPLITSYLLYVNRSYAGLVIGLVQLNYRCIVNKLHFKCPLKVQIDSYFCYNNLIAM